MKLRTPGAVEPKGKWRASGRLAHGSSAAESSGPSAGRSEGLREPTNEVEGNRSPIGSRNPAPVNTPFLGRFCAVLSLVLATCQRDPFAHTYTRQQPEFAELTGVYCLAFQTLDPSLDSAPSTEASGLFGHSSLTLQADGTFVALDFPTWSEEGHYELQSIDTFTGWWNVDTIGSVSDGETDTPVWGLRLDADGRDTTWAHLVGDRAPYTIHFSFGDPDAGDVMQYQNSAETSETGEPDFTIVSAFFLLFFAAITALGIAIVTIACALLALLALAAIATLVGGCLFVGALIVTALFFAVLCARAQKRGIAR